MSYEAVALRLAVKTGRTPEAIIMWDGECTTTRGSTSPIHVARRAYADGYIGDEIPDGWCDVHPDACDRCGSPFDPDVDHKHSGSMRWEWDTPSGKLEPGCVYLRDHYNGHCSAGWSSCEGPHLMVICPNGAEWDVDSRARNCGLPDDTTHRCWVRVGDPDHPETLHVSKDGETCAAGAGSIQAGDYHGFLVHGELSAG